jgi:hypothetical protein
VELGMIGRWADCRDGRLVVQVRLVWRRQEGAREGSTE